MQLPRFHRSSSRGQKRREPDRKPRAAFQCSKNIFSLQAVLFRPYIFLLRQWPGQHQQVPKESSKMSWQAVSRYALFTSRPKSFPWVSKRGNQQIQRGSLNLPLLRLPPLSLALRHSDFQSVHVLMNDQTIVIPGRFCGHDVPWPHFLKRFVHFEDFYQKKRPFKSVFSVPNVSELTGV